MLELLAGSAFVHGVFPEDRRDHDSYRTDEDRHGQRTGDGAVREVIASKAKQLDLLRHKRKQLRAELEAVEVQISKMTNELVLELRDDSRSTREEQVLALVRARKSDKEIGAALNIATRTAKFHVSRLLHKYGVQSRHDQ